MATRLPRGWQEIKVIGDVEPVRILVHRDTGKFGTTIDSENIKQHDSLSQAEQYIKDMQEEGAIDALIFDSTYGDAPIDLKPIRIRRAGRFWVRMDGTTLPYHETPYAPDPAIQETVADKRAEWKRKRDELQVLRDEISEIARGLKKLDTD